MHLSRVGIRNFRNFADVSVPLSQHVVLLGENRVGKSNFIHAIRLVLDATLPDSARQLKLSDIWDGAVATARSAQRTRKTKPETAADPVVEVHLDFSNFEDDPRLLALLTDYRRPSDHTVARLSYVFRKKADVPGPATSEAEFEFKVFGGEDEARSFSQQVRRRVSLDILPALRDAEGDLRGWRNSPLRPLLEDSVGRVSRDELEEASDAVNEATAKLAELAPVRELEKNLRTRMAELAGERHDIRATFGFAPSDANHLFRAIRLLIDDGRRGIGEASLGSANLALLTLKLAEFAWRRERNERSFTLLAVEEPEAHLHPQLQRKVFGELFQDGEGEARSLVLTTHSPNIASVAPLPSVVLLKHEGERGTRAYSLAELGLALPELADLQRYLDVTRAEILFARGAIFVEGDAEAVLVPVFARTLDIDLDDLGITVCSVAGTNFKPYVRLAAALALPFVVITDWDPRKDGKTALGWKRCVDLIKAARSAGGATPFAKGMLDVLLKKEALLRKAARAHGIFVNSDTLETEIAGNGDLLKAILEVLAEQNFGSQLCARIEGWRDGDEEVDAEQLLLMIGYVSKGRFAGELAAALEGLDPPTYIADALRNVAER